MSVNDRRSACDELLITALAAGRTCAEAATVACVSEKTVRRRLKEEPFAARVSQARAAIVTATAARLLSLTTVAVQTLEDLMDQGGNAAVRLRAAQAVLTQAREYRELGELEDRLQVLEAAIQRKKSVRP